MRYLSVCLLCLVFVWFEGCASTKPGPGNSQDAGQKSTFKTELITANFSISGGGLSTPVPIQYRARAQCKGVECIPEKAELSFFLEPGPNTVYLDDRTLSIEANGESYYWQGQDWTNIYHSPPVLGLIKMVRLKQDELVQIANARKVTGVLAGQNFEWTYQNRAPLRKMIAEMKSTETIKN